MNFKKLFLNKATNYKKIFSLIGQCRLQTEGSKYIQENNQPVIIGDIALVHNGIVVNHKELDISDNIGLDLNFTTSDSFNLCSYINKNITKKTIDEIFQYLNKKIIGSFSIGFINKKDNSLNLGTNTGSLYYILSDNLFIFGSEKNFMLKIKKKFNLSNEKKRSLLR